MPMVVNPTGEAAEGDPVRTINSARLTGMTLFSPADFRSQDCAALGLAESDRAER